MIVDLKHIKRIYFLGIGGIGMSAVARYFHGQAIEIFGYDLVRTPLTEALEKTGMHIHYEEDVSQIPEDVDLVILTPAIPNDHLELQWFRDQGYPILKRAEVLGLISRDKKCVAIAGTHGKTTTSAILTHMLRKSGVEVTAFVGGIMAAEKTNFIAGDSEWVILEADEYDRSFLQLYPQILIITSMDADHLDIYETKENMINAYRDLTRNLVNGGLLVLGPEVNNLMSAAWLEELKNRKIEVVTLGVDFFYKELFIDNGKYRFEYSEGEFSLGVMTSQLPGLHNVINTCLAARVVSSFSVVAKQAICDSVSSFGGINRRFELKHENGFVLIDDYAHHPEELKYAITTAKALYPTKKLLGVFQPHLYSRTRDHYREFALALSSLDEVIMLPIYPAREEELSGISSELIYNLIRLDRKQLVEGEQLIDKLSELEDIEVIITLGASDINKYHKLIIELLSNRNIG